MRGSREYSAPSPERAARAGARRPRGAANEAVPPLRDRADLSLPASAGSAVPHGSG